MKTKVVVLTAVITDEQMPTAFKMDVDELAHTIKENTFVEVRFMVDGEYDRYYAMVSTVTIVDVD